MAMRAEATFVRQQLSLHASYVRVCDSIERFSDDLRSRVRTWCRCASRSA